MFETFFVPIFFVLCHIVTTHIVQSWHLSHCLETILVCGTQQSAVSNHQVPRHILSKEQLSGTTQSTQEEFLWHYFCTINNTIILFLLLQALYFGIRLIFHNNIKTVTQTIWPKELLNWALGTAFLIKSKIHAHSDEKIAFSINFEEIALLTHTSMKLVNLYVFHMTDFQGSETH